MSDRITMGNDEFILYIRKQHPTELKNAQIGKRVWEWLEEHADGEQLDRAWCTWGPDAAGVGDTGLPTSATQFSFRVDALPDLYRFLARLGDGREEGK